MFSKKGNEMKNLKDYVKKHNQWTDIFGGRPLMLTGVSADRQAIANALDAALSPENLTCDGELSGKHVLEKQRYLFACAEELIRLDPTVTFYSLSV
jgi:hypothetical protein